MNIGKFSFTSGGQPKTQATSSPSTTNNQANSTNAKSSSLFSGGKNSSMNLSGINMKFSNITNITKKVSEGFSNIPNLGAHESSQEKKTKDEAQEKKEQIVQVMNILEDVNLQCPTNHSGIILTYTGKNMSPILSPGIKFTWFRMKGEESVDHIEESSRSWYSPSIEDIGAMICVQCEDNYGQGYSKYLECGPIKPDPLFQSMCETALNNGSYEAKEIFVSMGLSEDMNRSFQNHSEDFTNPANYPTALSKENAFVQLNGQSTIEVDESGIFISIPTVPTNKGKGGASNETKTSLNTGRRGLRIPANASMKVVSVQPSSIVLSIPVKQKNLENTVPPSDSPSSPSRARSHSQEGQADSPSKSKEGHEEGSEQPAPAEDDEKMRQFLSSSILAIPWTYEGHSLSPAAYIAENESKLSPEDRERLLREAEEDSIIFANTVVVLAEFISTVPEGTEEMLICFSCSDKLIRDILALTMKVFTTFPSSTNRFDRLLTAFPWMVETDDGEAHEGQADEAETELKKRLKGVEEENSLLKRERNELTKQLLETKEEISLLKVRVNQGGSAISSRSQHPAAAEEGENADGDQGENVTAALTSSENFKELSAKVIELENKLNISMKKESEATKARTDAEGKNAKYSAELEKLKKLNEDLKVNVTTLQLLSDRQSTSLQAKDDELVEKLKALKSAEEKLKEVDVLKNQLQEKNKIIEELKRSIDNLQKEVQNSQEIIAANSSTVDKVKNEYENKLKAKDASISQLDSQLAQKTLETKKQDVEIFELKEALRMKDSEIAEVAKFEGLYKEALSKNDTLAAEINHLIKKSESQTRDLKKTMKENATALAEFEKALIRKSEECNELYFKINAMKDAETARLAAEEQASNNAASNFISKISTTINTMREGGEGEPGANTSRKRSGSNAATAAGVSLFRRLSLSANNMLNGASSHAGEDSTSGHNLASNSQDQNA